MEKFTITVQANDPRNDIFDIVDTHHAPDRFAAEEVAAKVLRVLADRHIAGNYDLIMFHPMGGGSFYAPEMDRDIRVAVHKAHRLPDRLPDLLIMISQSWNGTWSMNSHSGHEHTHHYGGAPELSPLFDEAYQMAKDRNAVIQVTPTQNPEVNKYNAGPETHRFGDFDYTA